MNYEREIEKKYVVQGTFEFLERDLSALFPTVTPEKAESPDRFWVAPNVDFVRLRDNTMELTVKVTDRGTTTDRIEENVIVDDRDTTRRLLTLMFGQERSFIKRFTVWSLGRGVTVCLYKVLDDRQGRVFLEVEAPKLATVESYINVIKIRGFRMEQETQSLYQLFFQKEAA